MGQSLNVLPRTLRSKSAADGRHTVLYADLAFSASRISRICEALFILFSSVHERDTMLLTVVFTVMIV